MARMDPDLGIPRPVPAPVSVQSREGYTLWVRFEDGAEGLLDLTEDLKRDLPYTNPLRDLSVFRQATIGQEHRTIDGRPGPLDDYLPIVFAFNEETGEAWTNLDGTPGGFSNHLMWRDILPEYPYSIEWDPESLYVRCVRGDGTYESVSHLYDEFWKRVAEPR